MKRLAPNGAGDAFASAFFSFAGLGSAVSEGGVTGIHVCANTDWSMLLDSSLDIINFDAYVYMDSIGLYAESLAEFLDRGGYLAWGIAGLITLQALIHISVALALMPTKGIPLRVDGPEVPPEALLRDAVAFDEPAIRDLYAELVPALEEETGHEVGFRTEGIAQLALTVTGEPTTTYNHYSHAYTGNTNSPTS